MNGQGGVMRLYAIITAALVAVAIVSVSGGKVFADTTTSAGSAPVSQKITVQLGDTLSSIAASAKTTYVRIFDANSQIQNPDLIYPGEVLTIPSTNEVLPQRQWPLLTPSNQSIASSTVQVNTGDQDTPLATSSSVQSTPAVAQTSQQSTGATISSSIWYSLAQCESSGNWSIDTGNGFYGGLQFTLSSWQAVGGTGYPNQASPSQQILRAQMLQSIQGWGAWPVCSAKLGL